MSDSIDNNQQHNVALLNLESAEENENQPALHYIPNNGEISESTSRLDTSTNPLKKHNVSFRNDKNSENSQNDIEIVIEQDAKVVFY